MKSLFAPTDCSGPAGWSKEQGFPSTLQLAQKHFVQCCCCGIQDVPCLITSFSTRRCAWLSSLQINHQSTLLLFRLSVYLSSFHPRLSLWMLLRLLFSQTRWKGIWGMSPGPSFHLFLSLANLHQSVWKTWWLLLKKWSFASPPTSYRGTDNRTPEARASVVQTWQGGWRCSASGVSLRRRVWFLVQPAKTAREPLQEFNFCTKANLHLSGNL